MLQTVPLLAKQPHIKTAVKIRRIEKIKWRHPFVTTFKSCPPVVPYFRTFATIKAFFGCWSLLERYTVLRRWNACTTSKPLMNSSGGQLWSNGTRKKHSLPLINLCGRKLCLVYSIGVTLRARLEVVGEGRKSWLLFENL